MKQISQLASAALGLDTQRGDLLSIENLSFQQAPVEALAPVTKIEHWRHLIEPWVGSLRYVAIVLLFLIVYFLILRPVKKQILSTFREIPQHLAKGSAKLAAHEEKLPVLEPELSDSEEGRRANALKKQLTEKVKQEPAAATRLVQGWIRETK
jgi:flagellar M-ring protein FliF